MKKVGSILVFAFASTAIAGNCLAKDGAIPLNVLYLGRQQDGGRTEAFRDFLASRFTSALTAKRNDFNACLLADIDVVLLDWPQSERPAKGAPSPLGLLEEWDTPLVLLGSAGLLQAKSWATIGGAG